MFKAPIATDRGTENPTAVKCAGEKLRWAIESLERMSLVVVGEPSGEIRQERELRPVRPLSSRAK